MYLLKNRRGKIYTILVAMRFSANCDAGSIGVVENHRKRNYFNQHDGYDKHQQGKIIHHFERHQDKNRTTNEG